MVSVAIMGATGAVGRELLNTLDKRQFPYDRLKLLASERSAGKTIEHNGKPYTIELLTEDAFEDVDLVLSSAGGSVSKQFVPAAVKAGAVVVDNTSAFRMDPDVPLVVPEVNAGDVEKHNGIIANPNCSTIIMVVALAPLHRAAGVRRVVVSTYQSASGAGQAAMFEMIEHTRLALDDKPLPKAEKFAHSPAFNCLPHIDVFMENGYTKEEMKMVNETKKIMHDDSIRVTATTIRVPVMRCHSESLNVETERPLSVEEARKVLAEAPGVQVLDDPERNLYPMATEVALKDDVFVGRIRRDETIENGLNLWVVGDQLLKGAALNAVQIAEILVKKGLLAKAKA